MSFVHASSTMRDHNAHGEEADSEWGKSLERKWLGHCSPQRSKESRLGLSFCRIIPPNIRPKRLPQIFLLIPHFEGASSTWGSFLYMRKLPPMWGIILSCGESSHVAQAIFISFYSLKVKRRCWFHWFWVLRISLCRYRPRGSKGSFLQRRNIPLPKEYSSPKGIFLLKRKLPY